MKSFLLALATLSTLLAACVNLSPVDNQIHYYDIGTPLYISKKNTLKYPVSVKAVIGSFGNKIQFRNTDYGIEFDGDNRWTVSPQTLMAQYTRAYFNILEKGNEVDTSRNDIGVEIELTRFDYDLQTQQGAVGVNWNIMDPAQTLNGEFLSLKRGSIIVRGQRQQKKIDPGAALSSAANQFCELLAQEIIAVQATMAFSPEEN